MNPKLSQLSKDLSYDIFCFNGIINLASSVVKPDMHLNLISKSASPCPINNLLKDKLRLLQVTRTLLDSDKKSKIRQVNVLDSISFAAYKPFAKDFDMKNSPEFSCVGGMLLSQNTSLSLAWDIVHSYLLPPTPENFEQFILLTWIISKSLVYMPQSLCYSNNRTWVIWFDSSDFLRETVLPIYFTFVSTK